MDLRAFKDANITRHDSLMPGFAKTNMSTRPVSRIKVKNLGCILLSYQMSTLYQMSLNFNT